MPDELTTADAAESRRRKGASQRLFLICAGVAVLAGGIGVFVWHETRREEVDRHEILAQVDRISRGIRSHEQGLWMRVERHGSVPSFDPKDEEGHQKMLVDFERLSHLEDFRMTDITVHLDRDAAIVRYRIEGRPRTDRPCPSAGCTDKEPVPTQGVLTFKRSQSGWAPATSELK